MDTGEALTKFNYFQRFCTAVFIQQTFLSITVIYILLKTRLLSNPYILWFNRKRVTGYQTLFTPLRDSVLTSGPQPLHQIHRCPSVSPVSTRCSASVPQHIPTHSTAICLSTETQSPSILCFLSIIYLISKCSKCRIQQQHEWRMLCCEIGSRF